MDIGIWGDSITYGAGDSEALGWVGRLRKLTFQNEEICIYNRGVCGDTSKDLLRRFPVEVNSIKPDIILIAIGINDSKYPANEEENIVSLDEFKRNVSELFNMAKEHTEKLYVVGLTRVGEKWTDAGSVFLDDQISKYDEALKDMAEKENLIFIDVSNTLIIPTDLHDGLHPNSSGYQKIFDVVRKTLSLS